MKSKRNKVDFIQLSRFLRNRLLLTRRFAYVTVFALLLPLLWVQPVQGAALTWDGGCGVDTTWSCANNWSTNTVPVAADTLTFNGTSTNNSTIDAGFTGTVASLTISSGYTGTITMQRSLTITGNYSQAAGSFTAADQVLDMNGSFTLTAGNFTASSLVSNTAATNLAGAMTITASTPVFNANGGTWIFDGASSATLSCGGMTFSSVAFTHTANTKTVNSNCTLPVGANPSLGFSVTLAGTLTGSGTLTATAASSRLTLNQGYVLDTFTALAATNMTVGANAVANFGTYTTFDINSELLLSAGSSFTAPASTAADAMTVGGNFNQNATATFTHNSGRITFDTGSGTITCQGTPFNQANITHTSGTKTVAAGCTVPLATASPSVMAIQLNGTLAGSGTITFSTTATVASAAPLSGFTGLVASSTFTMSSGTVIDLSTYSLVDFNSTFTLSTGATFTAPTGTMTAAGNFTLSSGSTFNHSNGTIEFDGTSGTIACTGTTPFNTVNFTANSSNNKTVGAGCTLALGANPTYARSLTTVSTAGISGSGTLTFTSGTASFNAGSSLTGFTNLSTSSLTITTSGTFDLSGLTELDTNGTFTLNTSTGFIAPPTWRAGGGIVLTSGSTFNANSGTIILDSTVAASLNCQGATLNQVMIDPATTTNTKTISAGCTAPFGNDPTINSNLTIQGTVSGSGTFTATAGTLTLSSSTAAMTGFTTVAPAFMTVSGGASVTVDLSSWTTNLDVSRNFTVSGSGTTFLAPPTMSVAGNFTVSTGTTFNPGTGTVTLDGQDQTMSGPSITFYNLTKINTSEVGGLQFSGTVAMTILHDLVLRGSAAHYVGLTSSSTVTWSIDPQGSRDVEYVSVAFSNNISGTPIDAVHSLDNEGNTNWTFTPPSSSAGNAIHFEDSTTASGLDPEMVGVYSHAAAWGDVNNDNNLDLFVGAFTNGSRPDGEEQAPNLLLIGDGQGGFTKSDQPTLAVFGQASGVVFVDLDNDNDQDIVLSNLTTPGDSNPRKAEPHHAYENLGDGTFEDISDSSGIVDAGPIATGRTVSAIDYNADGFMDLLMHADDLVGGPGYMRLVKNNGDMTFSNVTAAAGLPTDFSGLGVAIADANGDSYADIVVSGGEDPPTHDTNGFREFRLYMNNANGTFRDATPDDLAWDTQGSGHDDWTAGAMWGDLNNDGRLDLVTGQHFESTYRVAPLSLKIYMNTGNDGNGDPILDLLPLETLEPIASKQPHIELQDFDNDGWVDIFTSALVEKGGTEGLYVYKNTGTLDGDGYPSFIRPDYDTHPKALSAGVVTAIPYYAPGAPAGDYDNDGKIDVFMCGLDVLDVPSLWHNVTPDTGNWLKVKVTSDTNTQGIGAIVKLYEAGHGGEADYLLGTRAITMGGGYVSAAPSLAHFGLGDIAEVDVEVTMPNEEGSFSQADVDVNQTLTITASEDADPDTPDPTSSPSTSTESSTTSSSSEASEPVVVEEPPVDEDGTILLDDIQAFVANKTVTIELKVGQRLSFSLPSIGPGGDKETHTITLKKIGPDYVILTFASTPRDVKIKIGQTVQQDVNDDGQPDVQVKLASLVDGVATLEIKSLARIVDKNETKSNQSDSGNSLVKWLAVSVVIALGLVVYVRSRAGRRTYGDGMS